jgi:hypothetical protein
MCVDAGDGSALAFDRVSGRQVDCCLICGAAFDFWCGFQFFRSIEYVVHVLICKSHCHVHVL